MNHEKKGVKIYRNGDSTYPPITYHYDPKRVRTFKNLIDELQNSPAVVYGTRITRLYTIDGRRIMNVEDFQQSDVNDFVATGPEGFMRIRGGYQSHPDYQPDQSKPVDDQQMQYNQEAQHVNFQRPRTSNRPVKPAHPLFKENTNDQISYLALNKQTYGDMHRFYEDRLENRVDIGTVKKLFLYRNGDPLHKYAEFAQRAEAENISRYGPEFAHCLHLEIHMSSWLISHADPKSWPKIPSFRPKLYVYKSKVHRKWDKFLEDLERIAPPIKGGGVRHLYTIKGKEITSFDQLQDRKGYVVAGGEGFQKLNGGYEPIKNRPLSAIPQFTTPRPGTQMSARPKTGGRPKSGVQRGPGESIHERRLPEPTFFLYAMQEVIVKNRYTLFLYSVFKNGDGLEAKRFLFTPQQMSKGFHWILEQVGRRFSIYAHKLVTMDNREVIDHTHFINRGAYIVIPFGEKFKENWHHFPEMAIDTSVFKHSVSDLGLNRRHSSASRPRTSRSRSQSRLSRSQSVLSRLNRPYSGRVGATENGYEPSRAAQSDDEYIHEHREHGQPSTHYGHQEEIGYHRRSASVASHCSFCDMLENQKLKHKSLHHQPHSADDINMGGRKKHTFTPDEGSSDHDHKHALYSGDHDHHDILPPRPASSRRVRLSPHEMPDDHEYPMRSSSLNHIMPQPSLDEVVNTRRGSKVDELTRLPSLTRARSENRIETASRQTTFNLG